MEGIQFQFTSASVVQWHHIVPGRIFHGILCNPQDARANSKTSDWVQSCREIMLPVYNSQCLDFLTPKHIVCPPEQKGRGWTPPSRRWAREQKVVVPAAFWVRRRSELQFGFVYFRSVADPHDNEPRCPRLGVASMLKPVRVTDVRLNSIRNPPADPAGPTRVFNSLAKVLFPICRCFAGRALTEY